ncbi:MAG: hypothetical protein Q9211_000877 [Gyalolechia sp. 1 TL-2023]
MDVLWLPPLHPRTLKSMQEPSSDVDSQSTTVSSRSSYSSDPVSKKHYYEISTILTNDAGSDERDHTNACFRLALGAGLLPIASHPIDWGIPVERWAWQDNLQRAMDLELYGFLQLFLDHGFDTNHEANLAPFSSTAVSRTYYYFHDIDMTRWFLDHGADPNRKTRGCWAECTTPLSWAVLFASLETIKMLFDRGGPESNKHGYLLYHAAHRPTPDRLDVLEYIVFQGGLADVNKLEYHDDPILASDHDVIES